MIVGAPAGNEISKPTPCAHDQFSCRKTLRVGWRTPLADRLSALPVIARWLAHGRELGI